METPKSAPAAHYKLWFHVPVNAVEACKKAIFDAGAGRYPGPGDYTEVCFVTIGKGQFRPGQSAIPHIGKVGELEHVDEAKVETICVGEEVVKRVVAALKKSHPYETPSYSVVKLEDF